MIVSVRAVPGARKLAIEKLGEASYKVRLDAPATEGNANRRLVEAMADYLGVPKSSISIVRGLKGRTKLLEIR